MITRRHALSGTAGLIATGTAQAAKAEDQNTAEALEQIRASASATALAASVYDRTGLVKAYASGVRRVGHEEAVTPQDRWHIGSNTKAMTAALWARLVEQGVAQWNMSLADAAAQSGLDVAVHAQWEGVTVEHLLRHRGGLEDGRFLDVRWLQTARTDPASLPEQRATLASAALALAPEGEIGRFAYGNANYMVVGALIEGLCGLSWEEAMQAQVFAPLGMVSAGFGAPADPAPWGHRAMMGLKIAMNPTDSGSDNPLALGPAGTVHLNLEDYGRFLVAILNGGGDWLSTESIERLVTPVAGEDYALGWIVVGSQPWAKGPVIAHEGSNTMWHTFAALDLGAGKAWVATSNDGSGGAVACPQAGLFLARNVNV